MTERLISLKNMTDDSEGVQAPQESRPPATDLANFGSTSIARAASLSIESPVRFEIDVAAILEYNARRPDKSVEARRAFVQSSLDKIAYETQGRANIMIFNRRQIGGLNSNKETTKYAEHHFHDILYGAWVFAGAGTFVSEGEYGWENWGFYGQFDYDKPNKTVHFRARF